jgi:hypothetical protein
LQSISTICPLHRLASLTRRSKDSHLLLTTLILGNMIVNEALPVVMDAVIGGGIVAVVASTALVVV